jgi:hypothetical protein
VRFLVRFPPHRKVTDVMSLPSFNLRKEGVQVEVVEWVDDLDHFSQLKEAWIQIEGIPPKWCDCKVFAQIVSGFGLSIEVDWSSLFKLFFERIRVKVVCRNPLKIPSERLFELDKKLFLVSMAVEGYEQEAKSKSTKGDDDDDDQGDGDDETQEDDFDDYDDLDDIRTWTQIGQLISNLRSLTLLMSSNTRRAQNL